MTVERLAASTWPDVKAGIEGASEGPTLLLPLGGTAQIGPHLPLGVDTDLAVALVRTAAERLRDIVVAPPISYGASGGSRRPVGTISVGARAIELLLVELGRSASESFPRVLIVFAHGGNTDAVNRAVARLRGEGRDVRAFAPGWDHRAGAARSETSLMLAIDEWRVRMDRAAGGNAAPLSELIARLRKRGDSGVVVEEVLGDAAAASLEEGLDLFDSGVGDLIAVVSDWDPLPSRR